MFGDRLDLAEKYAAWLAEAGSTRGLIGPREIPRLWERHILNSAVIETLIPPDSRVADIGSGAGLPGIPLAIARPDLQVTLVESLLRRTKFLDEVVQDLDLDNVHIIQGRIEQQAVLEPLAERFDVVTSRAVAAMKQLARWSLPLVRLGGLFLPMKGSTVEHELSKASATLITLGAESGEIVKVGAGIVDDEVTVVRAKKVRKGRRPVRGRLRLIDEDQPGPEQ